MQPGTARRGRDRDEEDPPVFLDDAMPLSRLGEDGSLAVELRLAPSAVGDPDVVGRATQALKSHRGQAPVFVIWPEGDANAETREHRLRSKSLGVQPSQVLLEELRTVFGRERVRLIRGPNGGGNGHGNGESRLAARATTGGD